MSATRVKTRSRRQQDAEKGHLAIKVAEVEERYFNHFAVFDVLPPRGPFDVTGMSPELMEAEANHWFWYDIFAEEVLGTIHRHAVLRYIVEDEIRQENILANRVHLDFSFSSISDSPIIGNEEIFVFIERAKVAKERDSKAVCLQDGGRVRDNTDINFGKEGDYYGDGEETDEILNFKHKYGILQDVRLDDYYGDMVNQEIPIDGILVLCKQIKKGLILPLRADKIFF
ncbi:hypothetical protein GIB67_037931 [Kingdonia uniflora]|uniref:Uncharacterized protein n=1 Tax=Kingdonia uniflora TaxID=39325 RepID=A0A7J7LH49_9MAGN|nr:hypothetical protein GIB67_037931 [Kingdonia uniflora]